MRINQDKMDTGEFSFVFHFGSQIVETPRMLLAPLWLLNPYPITDSFEVFKSNAATGAFSLLNNLFGDHMVDISGKPRFFLPTFLKQAFSGLSSFRLKFLSKSGMSGSKVIDAAPRKMFAVAVSCNIDNAQVNAKKVVGLAFRWFGHFDTNIEIELPVAVNQVSLPACSADVQVPVIAENKGYINSAFQCLDIDSIGKLEFPEPVVVNDSAMWFEFMVFLFIALAGISHFTYSPDSHLGSKPKFLTDGIVAKTMQTYMACCMLLVCYTGNIGASSIERFHSFEKLLLLLLGCL